MWPVLPCPVCALSPQPHRIAGMPALSLRIKWGRGLAGCTSFPPDRAGLPFGLAGLGWAG